MVAFVVVIGVNNILDMFVCVAREFLLCCCCSCKHTLDGHMFCTRVCTICMCVSVLVECCTLMEACLSLIAVCCKYVVGHMHVCMNVCLYVICHTYICTSTCFIIALILTIKITKFAVVKQMPYSN